MRAARVGMGVGVVAGLLAHEFLRDWGASALERLEYLPGDELVPDPVDSSTLAVDIDVPAAEVWAWLVQLGQDRAGMYSYDWLERMVGLGMHNAERIHPEWQELAAGDTVRLVPRGWLGRRDGLALPVAQVVPGQSIVLRIRRPDLPWDAVWSFHVMDTRGQICRLVARSRAARSTGALRVVDAVVNPVTWLMTRRMLLGIKQRAERAERVAARPDRAVTTRQRHPARPVTRR